MDGGAIFYLVVLFNCKKNQICYNYFVTVKFINSVDLFRVQPSELAKKYDDKNYRS